MQAPTIINAAECVAKCRGLTQNLKNVKVKLASVRNRSGRQSWQPPAVKRGQVSEVGCVNQSCKTYQKSRHEYKTEVCKANSTTVTYSANVRIDLRAKHM